MKRILFSLIFLASACLVISSNAQQRSRQSKGNAASIEREVFRLINKKRSSSGKPALVINDVVSRLARSHSAAMASGKVRFGHAGFDDRSDQINARVGRISGIAENVAIGSDAEAAVAMWWRSAGHKKNMLGTYKQTGIGVARKGTQWYFTQIFISKM